MCHFLVLQMAKRLECKATEAISPTAPKSSRTVISHWEVFASSLCSKTVLFVFNVTCDIWPGLSALFVSHCVELNESFFQISYRDALCETIETPLRPLNCSIRNQAPIKKVLSIDLRYILLYCFILQILFDETQALVNIQVLQILLSSSRGVLPASRCSPTAFTHYIKRTLVKRCETGEQTMP